MIHNESVRKLIPLSGTLKHMQKLKWSMSPRKMSRNVFVNYILCVIM